MKACTLLAAGLVMGVATTAWAVPSPLLHYSFDGDYTGDPTGFTAFNSGSLGSVADLSLGVKDGSGTRESRDLHSALGVGVDGVGRALDQREIGVLSPEGHSYNAQNYTAGAVTGIESLASFTITVWYQGPLSRTEPHLGNRYLIDAGNYLSGGGFTVQGELRVDGQPVTTQVVPTNNGDPLEWKFMAVQYKYDSEIDTAYARVLQGSKNAAVTEISSHTWGPGHVNNVGVTGASGEYFALGGRQATGNSTSRTFDGLLDDFMLFGSKVDASGYLSDDDINAIRLATVPEPAVASVLGLGSLLMLCRRSRRQA